MIPGAPIDWSGDKGEILRTLWIGGKPIAVIARALHVSEKSVKRGASILGLAQRPGNRGNRISFTFGRTADKPQGPLAIPDNVPVIGSVPLAKLKPNQCRYPFGNPQDTSRFGFCGHRIRAGRPYCPVHDDLCHVKRAEPKAEEIAA